MVEILHEINYIALFMLVFMTLGIVLQTRKIAYNWLLLGLYVVLGAILFSSWNTLPDLSYRFPGLSLYDMPFTFSLGPLLYLIFGYSKKEGLNRRQLWFFVPGLIAFLLTIPYYLETAESKRYRIQELFTNQDVTVYDVYYVIGVLYTSGFVLYLIYSYRRLMRIQLVANDQYLLYLAGVLLASVMVAVSAILGIAFQDYSFYRLCALIIATALHVYFVLGFRYPGLHESMVTLSDQRTAVESGLPDTKIKSIADKLTRIMEAEKLYRNENLSLSSLAEQVEVSIHHLSEYLNNVLGKNFYTFVNEFRVKEATQLLKTSEDSVIDIAFTVGFNSKATFNRTFKNITGTTPKDYRNG